MRMLLTSGGVSTPLLQDALIDLLGRPIDACTALCIPTAQYGHPWCTPYSARRFITGDTPAPMCDLGWKRVGVLELTALPTIGIDRWQPWVREADVLLVGGGDALYLRYWLENSGLAEMLPTLDQLVWVGVSAGSMVMTPRVGPHFTQWQPPGGGDETLGMVDFCLFPHLNHPDMPENSLASAEKWAEHIGHPSYAMDDRTGIRVVDGEAAVISDGEWYRLPAGA